MPEKFPVIKRKGHKEKYDERKVYASCYSACLASHIPIRQTEKICEKVSKKISTFVKKKKSVTSDQIFSEAAKSLSSQDKNAAFMYKTHRDVS